MVTILQLLVNGIYLKSVMCQYQKKSKLEIIMITIAHTPLKSGSLKIVDLIILWAIIVLGLLGTILHHYLLTVSQLRLKATLVISLQMKRLVLLIEQKYWNNPLCSI